MFARKNFNKMGLTIEIPQKREYNGAVPQEYRLGTCQPISLLKDRYGMGVTMHWKSSTGDLRDLEGVRSKELINPVNATGTLADLATVASDWQHLQTTTGYAVDEHGLPASATTGPGTAEAHQLFLHKGPLTDTVYVAADSGFKIEKFIEQDPTGPKGQMRVRTEKKGATVTIGEYTGSAGAGNEQILESVTPQVSQAGSEEQEI